MAGNYSPGIARRLAALDWPALEASLDAVGYAVTPPLLTEAECARIAGMFGEERRFRSRISMERYRFGVGEYGYFAAPLPPLVRALRRHAYPRLAPLANRWAQQLAEPRGGELAAPRGEQLGVQTGERLPYPVSLDEYSALCHAAGQVKPTPLLLRYAAGGHNRLHQDRYGDLCFPLQIAVCLSRPGEDYQGGSFLLVENLPRQQSRGEALLPPRGALMIFPSAERPVAGKRGWLRAKVRHGVSTITAGERYTLGIIFHDAK